MSTATASERVESGVVQPDESARFVRQVREIVKDLIQPNPVIYWTDLLITLVVANVAFAFYVESPLWSAAFWLGYVVGAIASYRCTVFSHEIAHFRVGTFRAFRLVWNTFCGVPLMFPEFLYEDHKSHHVNHSYGTAEDGEYLPLGRGTLVDIGLYLAQIFLVPIMGIVRFLILAPLSWCVPSIRTWVLGRSTNAVTINLKYQLPIPKDEAQLRLWKIQEVACFAYGVAFLTLIGLGVLPWTILIKIYFLFLLVATLNYSRTLGAHRYLSHGGPATYLEQLLDSYTIPGHPLFTEIWAPLGMRYHALHHLVPSMPYHNMGKAHRRLVRQLPADSPYRETIRPHLGQAVFEVVRAAWYSGRKVPAAT
jgi:fatty acid desaturase